MAVQFWNKSIIKISRLIIIVTCIGIFANVISLLLLGKVRLAPTIPIAVLVGIVISVKFIEHEVFSKTGIEFHMRDVLYILIGSMAVVIFYGVAITIECIAQSENLFPEYANNLINGLGRSTISVLFIPISEEMLWRGYVLGCTFGKLKYWQKNVISALLFSMPHWFYVSGTGIITFLLVNVISTFMIGLVLGSIRILTKSIWCGVGVHWTFNYFCLCIFSGNSPTTTFVFVSIIASAVSYCFIQRILRKQISNNS